HAQAAGRAGPPRAVARRADRQVVVAAAAEVGDREGVAEGVAVRARAARLGRGLVPLLAAGAREAGRRPVEDVHDALVQLAPVVLEGYAHGEVGFGGAADVAGRDIPSEQVGDLGGARHAPRVLGQLV